MRVTLRHSNARRMRQSRANCRRTFGHPSCRSQLLIPQGPSALVRRSITPVRQIHNCGDGFRQACVTTATNGAALPPRGEYQGFPPQWLYEIVLTP